MRDSSLVARELDSTPMSQTRPSVAFSLAALLAAASAQAGECSGWLPDFDRDCERRARPSAFVASPASPFTFEDAFVVTGVRTLHVFQQMPKGSLFADGEAEAVTGELRAAITDRVGVSVAKAGALWIRPENPLVPKRQAPTPLTLGVKLALAQNHDAQRYAAISLRYADAFQGGDGSLVPSLAGALKLGSFTLQGDAGGSWAIDSSFSSSLFWHVHVAYARIPVIAPFVQLSGQHWIDGGDGRATLQLTPLGQQFFRAKSVSIRAVEGMFGTFEGADLVNLGAHDIAGRELVTGAAGLRLRLARFSLSAAYERPLTRHRGVFGERITTSVSLEL
jgi:hypothetical protein